LRALRPTNFQITSTRVAKRAGRCYTGGISGKEIEMEMNEIKERIAEVQELITELHGDRQRLIMDFGINLGITSKDGINLTELGEWAREVIDLNAEMAELANERKALRALKKELNPCVCACH
jgi:DNA repair exonuclease SbcCD ATPase subunit